MDVKRCRVCLEEKPHDQFYASPGNRDGLQGICKPCESLRSREVRYGLSAADWDAQVEAQGGLCPVCLDPLAGKLQGDHDHDCCPGVRTCGKCFRGILHQKCNTGIGQLRDDPEILRRAADYIERGRA